MGGITVKCTGLDNNVLEMACQFCMQCNKLYFPRPDSCVSLWSAWWWDSTLIHTYLFGHI